MHIHLPRRWSDVRRWLRRDSRADATAGLVLGVESVPDGLASGLLAGINPLWGLYGYLFGMVGAVAFTGSALMAVQATSAMSLVVADADIAQYDDPGRALFTLSILTGVLMIAAGIAQGGRLLRFVPTAVMNGFITAVGVNMVLGQLDDFTGYDAKGANRIARTINLLLHPWRIDAATITVGLTTVGLILVLTRTRLSSFGLVVAVVGASAAAAVFNAADLPVALVSDIADIPRALPAPQAPDPSLVLELLVPAASLMFVGLIQGAAISMSSPNPDGTRTDPSADFIGQGAGNLVSGVFQGMPVGGSMSATSLARTGGARTRASLLIAGVVMAVVILCLGAAIGYIAMPALAGLLIVVGFSTIKPQRVMSVVRTGPLQTSVLGATFVLTILIPLQFAVLVGVGMAIVLYVAQQSNRLVVHGLEVHGERLREVEAARTVRAGEIAIVQPSGDLFFASTPQLRSQLPHVTGSSNGAVVIIRLRGVEHVGLAAAEVLRDYATALQEHGSTLKLVLGGGDVEARLSDEGVLALVGEHNVYRGSEWLGETVRRAHHDALVEVGAANGEV